MDIPTTAHLPAPFGFSISPVALPRERMVHMLKGRDVVLSPLSGVRYFEAHGKYTRVVLEEDEGLLRSGLSRVAQHLPATQFLRIHRSLIVNKALVVVARRDEFGRMAVYTAGRPEKLVVAQPHEHLFGEGIF